MQAVDFSALSAQAVARVEQARQAAQQQIAAALQQKPKLALRLLFEAPKIAIPVPEGTGYDGMINQCSIHALVLLSQALHLQLSQF